MGIVHFDGFDNYSVADVLASRVKGTWLGSATTGVIGVPGVYGVGQYLVSQGNSSAHIQRVYAASSSWSAGLHYYAVTNLPGTNMGLIQLLNGGTAVATLWVMSDGTVKLAVGGSSATAGAQSTRVLTPQAWTHIEINVSLATSGGTFTVRVNGEVWATLTGNTGSSATTADRVNLGVIASPGGTSHRIDNCYVADDIGPYGELRCINLTPSAAGATSGMTNSAGTSVADYPARLTADAPLHRWDLQEASGTVADTGSGTASAGTPAGSPLMGQTAEPQLYDALKYVYFNGGNNIAMPAQADMNITGDITVVASVYLTAYPTGANSTIVSRGAATSTQTFALGVSTAGQVLFQRAATSTAVTGTSAVPLNQWAILMVVVSSASATAYINGQYAGSAGVPAASSHASLGVEIGRRMGPNDQSFVGRVSHVAIWNTALTAAQAALHANFNNAAAVDDGPSGLDSDLSYVYSGVATTKDTYKLFDLPAAITTVKAVSAVVVARKDDTAARTLATVLRSGGADYDGSTVTLTGSYANYDTLHATDPATSAAWSVAAVNALEAGAKVIA